MLTGLHAGELVLIAARPSMGKTSFGMNIVENAAIRAGKKAAVFSLEMPAEQLAMRMLCTEAKVDMQRVRRGQISDEEWGKLSEAMIAIGPSGMFVDASSGVTVAEVRSKARRLQLEQGLDLIMIDYIQLMTASGRFGSRQEEVSAISRSLRGWPRNWACRSSPFPSSPARPRAAPTIAPCSPTSANPAPSSRMRTW